MTVSLRGKTDSALGHVYQALKAYHYLHPEATIHTYRQNAVAIRVRIVDPAFAGISRADRHELVWKYIEGLPEDVQSQMSLVIPLTPEELDTSLANLEFDNPLPSTLR